MIDMAFFILNVTWLAISSSCFTEFIQPHSNITNAFVPYIVFAPTPHSKMNLMATIHPIGVIPITMAIGSCMAMLITPIRSVPDIKQHPLGHGERFPAPAVLGQEHGEGPVEQFGLDLTSRTWGAPHVGT